MSCSCYIDEEQNTEEFCDYLYALYLKESYGIEVPKDNKDYSLLLLRKTIADWENKNKI